MTAHAPPLTVCSIPPPHHRFPHRLCFLTLQPFDFSSTTPLCPAHLSLSALPTLNPVTYRLTSSPASTPLPLSYSHPITPSSTSLTFLPSSLRYISFLLLPTCPRALAIPLMSRLPVCRCQKLSEPPHKLLYLLVPKRTAVCQNCFQRVAELLKVEASGKGSPLL